MHTVKSNSHYLYSKFISKSIIIFLTTDFCRFLPLNVPATGPTQQPS